jgi:hypothetical protein
VSIIALIGALIGFASHFPYWNWFGFSTCYVVVMIADHFVAWLLVGLVIANVVPAKKRN